MDADLVVVGLGTAGAACAALAAEGGLRVIGLESKPLDEAGARWINGVPLQSFEEAGLEAPEPPELRLRGGAFHLVCGWGSTRLTLDDRDVAEVDMRHLCARLQKKAADAGADLREQTRGLRVSAQTLQTSSGPITARWFIDASGLTGARLLDQPQAPATDLCSAAQEVRQVVDRDAALKYLEQHEAREGDVLCFTGVAGGYSIVNVRLEGDEVSILTGSVTALGNASGRTLLDRFCADQPWVGERIFGGARAIPLARAPRVLAKGPTALLGDSASQVFAAHGSGISAGLVGARMVVDALKGPGDLQAYARAWRGRFAGTFAAYDVFRRFSHSLKVRDLERLMSSGLMDEVSARAAMHQELPRYPAHKIPGKLAALVRAPDLALRLGKVGIEMASASFSEGWLRPNLDAWMPARA